VQKKMPCSECRRWYQPDSRVGDRQRTCGSPECKKARRRRTNHGWRAEHRDYDRSRRWQAKLDAAKAGERVTWPSEPRPLREVPWDLAQAEMGTKATVIIGEISRLALSRAQAEMTRQLTEIAGQFGGHAPGGAASRECNRVPTVSPCGGGP